jgi:ferredoxin
MNNKISVKIILDPENTKSESVSLLQLLNKAGMDIGFHCKDGHCGYCKIDSPLTKNVKVKEGEVDLAYYEKSKESLACISVLDKTVSELNPEGLLEIDFVLPQNSAGRKLKEYIESGELSTDKMWVYDFANRESKIATNTILKVEEKIKIKNLKI